MGNTKGETSIFRVDSAGIMVFLSTKSPILFLIFIIGLWVAPSSPTIKKASLPRCVKIRLLPTIVSIPKTLLADLLHTSKFRVTTFPPTVAGTRMVNMTGIILC